MVLDNPSTTEFDALFAENRFVAVDFYATWCGPCKAYSPKFARAHREVRRQRPDVPVAFVAVDVDRNHDLAGRHSVRSVPTTVVLAESKGWFRRSRRVEVLRFSGDKAWPDLVRSLLDAIG